MQFEAWWRDQIVLSAGGLRIEFRPKIPQADSMKYRPGGLAGRKVQTPIRIILMPLPAPTSASTGVAASPDDVVTLMSISTFPGHARDHQNPVDLRNLEADIPTSQLTQDSPTTHRHESDAIPFSLYQGDVHRPGKQRFISCSDHDRGEKPEFMTLLRSDTLESPTIRFSRVRIAVR